MQMCLMGTPPRADISLCMINCSNLLLDVSEALLPTALMIRIRANLYAAHRWPCNKISISPSAQCALQLKTDNKNKTKPPLFPNVYRHKDMTPNLKRDVRLCSALRKQYTDNLLYWERLSHRTSPQRPPTPDSNRAHSTAVRL